MQEVKIYCTDNSYMYCPICNIYCNEHGGCFHLVKMEKAGYNFLFYFKGEKS
jgi:hypothetical protein